MIQWISFNRTTQVVVPPPPPPRFGMGIEGNYINVVNAGSGTIGDGTKGFVVNGSSWNPTVNINPMYLFQGNDIDFRHTAVTTSNFISINVTPAQCFNVFRVKRNANTASVAMPWFIEIEGYVEGVATKIADIPDGRADKYTPFAFGAVDTITFTTANSTAYSSYTIRSFQAVSPTLPVGLSKVEFEFI
jgi:hypothetical protein